MKRQIAIDIGASSSAICYRDYEDFKSSSEPCFVPFKTDEKSLPTLMITKGSFLSKDGSVISTEESFGWEAYGETQKYINRDSSFKMDLLSSDESARETAKERITKFFDYLYRGYDRFQKKNGNSVEISFVKTVVTYPLSFTEKEQLLLKSAAERAGFPNVELCSEADAAIHHIIRKRPKKFNAVSDDATERAPLLMLIDMGAETTDIAILEYDPSGGNHHSPVSPSPVIGNTRFGGNEIDDYLYRFYMDKLDPKTILQVLEIENEKLAQTVIRDELKIYKEDILSSKLKAGEIARCAPILRNCAAASRIGMDELSLSRADFEHMLSNYLTQFPAIVRNAIDSVGISGKEISAVILTGGHSQWYFVKDMLLNQCGLSITENDIIEFDDPHLAVAYGAAYYDKDAILPSRKHSTAASVPQHVDDEKEIPLAAVKQNGLWGFIDERGKLVVPPQWDDVLSFRNGAAVVAKDGYFGFIDKSGKTISPCKWEKVFCFSHGFAFVCKDGKFGVIDKIGTLVVPCQWDEIVSTPNNENLNVYFFSKDGKWGACDASGRILFPCQWDGIDCLNANYRCPPYFKVKKEGKWGVIDHSGNLVLSCQWDSLKCQNDVDTNDRRLIQVEKNGSFGLIDYDGGIVIPDLYEDVCYMNENLIIVKENGKFEFLFDNGKRIARYHLDSWEFYGDSLIKTKQSGRYLLFDSRGALASPFRFRRLDDFSEGLAYAEDCNGWRGYIDQNGTKKFSYDSSYRSASDSEFHEGLAPVEKGLLFTKRGYINTSGVLAIGFQNLNFAGAFHEGLARIKRNNAWEYIDTHGKTVIKPSCSDASDFKNGLAKIRYVPDDTMVIDGTTVPINDPTPEGYGYINRDGKSVVPCEYDEVRVLDCNLIAVAKDGKIGYYDKNGACLVPCLWDEVGACNSDKLRYMVIIANQYGEDEAVLYGFTDYRGNVVLPCQFENIKGFS